MPTMLSRRRYMTAALSVAALARSPAWAHADVHTNPSMLKVVGPWEITGLEPASSGYLFTRMRVTETLMDADDAGNPLPALAARWSMSVDGRLWRFELRSKAQFHDGVAVSAEQVVRILKRAAARSGVLANTPVQSITAEGSSIVIALKAPFAALTAVLAHSSTMVLAASSFDAKGNVVAIVGSGPYRISTLEAPHGFDTQAYDRYDGTAPSVRRASYLAVGRSETRALMAEAGQADVAFGLDPASIDRLRKSTRVRIESVTVPRSMIIKVNAGHRWLSDKRARQALSLALNRAGIARALLRDPALTATQLFPPSLSHWHVQGMSPLRTDLAMAHRLWQELGWQRGADGIFQRNGERLSFTLHTFPDRPELPLVVAAIQEQCRQSGVEIRVTIGNSGDIPARHRDGSLELALAARQYAIVPDPIGTLLQDFGANGGDWGAMNWSHPALQATLNELATLPPSATAAQRDRLRAQVAEVLQDELPVIPVAWYRQTAAVSQRVQAFTIDPLERSYRIDQLRWVSATVHGR